MNGSNRSVNVLFQDWALKLAVEKPHDGACQVLSIKLYLPYTFYTTINTSSTFPHTAVQDEARVGIRALLLCDTSTRTAPCTNEAKGRRTTG